MIKIILLFPGATWPQMGIRLEAGIWIFNAWNMGDPNMDTKPSK